MLGNLDLAEMLWGFPGGSDGKESACYYRRCRFNPWDRKVPWRSKWQPTPVFMPGKSRGPRSLVGYSPWGRKESDTTERLLFLLYFNHLGMYLSPDITVQYLSFFFILIETKQYIFFRDWHQLLNIMLLDSYYTVVQFVFIAI